MCVNEENEVARLFVLVGACLGKSASEMQPYIEKVVSENWYDTLECLRHLTESQWREMNLPLRLVTTIRQELSAGDVSISLGCGTSSQTSDFVVPSMMGTEDAIERETIISVHSAISGVAATKGSASSGSLANESERESIFAPHEELLHSPVTVEYAENSNAPSEDCLQSMIRRNPNPALNAIVTQNTRRKSIKNPSIETNMASDITEMSTVQPNQKPPTILSAQHIVSALVSQKPSSNGVGSISCTSHDIITNPATLSALSQKHEQFMTLICQDEYIKEFNVPQQNFGDYPEHLETAWNNILCQVHNTISTIHREKALNTIGKLIDGVLLDINNTKKRVIRHENKTFLANVAVFEIALKLLQSAGFLPCYKVRTGEPSTLHSNTGQYETAASAVENARLTRNHNILSNRKLINEEEYILIPKGYPAPVCDERSCVHSHVQGTDDMDDAVELETALRGLRGMSDDRSDCNTWSERATGEMSEIALSEGGANDDESYEENVATCCGTVYFSEDVCRDENLCYYLREAHVKLLTKISEDLKGSSFNPFKSNFSGTCPENARAIHNAAANYAAELLLVEKEIKVRQEELRVGKDGHVPINIRINAINEQNLPDIDPKDLEPTAADILAYKDSLTTEKKFSSRRKAELEKLRKKTVFNVCCLKIVFPDKNSLLLDFAPRTPFSQVYLQLAKLLQQPFQNLNNWKLAQNWPPRTFNLQETLSLQELKLVPSSTLFFRTDSNHSNFILPHLIQQ